MCQTIKIANDVILFEIILFDKISTKTVWKWKKLERGVPSASLLESANVEDLLQRMDHPKLGSMYLRTVRHMSAQLTLYK